MYEEKIAFITQKQKGSINQKACPFLSMVLSTSPCTIQAVQMLALPENSWNLGFVPTWHEPVSLVYEARRNKKNNRKK